MNKDMSLQSVIRYDKLNTQADTAAIQDVCDFLLRFTSGWAVWVDRQFSASKEKVYITILWNPFIEQGKIVNFPFSNEQMTAESLYHRELHVLRRFQEAVYALQEKLSKIVNAEVLTMLPVLQYLKQTLSPDSAVEMPPIPLYLDAYLSLDISLAGQNANALEIDGKQVRIITPLGFMDSESDFVSFLQRRRRAYRLVRRMLFASEKRFRDAEEKYMKNWCENRGSILSLLEYGDLDGKACGLYTHSLLLYEHEADTEAAQFLRESGIPTVVEDYNLRDVWLGSIPGMFRSNIVPPMMCIEDVSSLIALPKSE